MAGSYNMARTDLARYAKFEDDEPLIENMGDAWEAIEEMVWLIETFMGHKRADLLTRQRVEAATDYEDAIHMGSRLFGESAKRWEFRRVPWLGDDHLEVWHEGSYVGAISGPHQYWAVTEWNAMVLLDVGPMARRFPSMREAARHLAFMAQLDGAWWGLADQGRTL